MATTATFSGTIAGFRQGVSIRTEGQLLGTVGQRLFGGDSMILTKVLSGSGIRCAPPNSPFFYDSAAGIGRERLSTSGSYIMVVNHGLERLTYGDLELFQLPNKGDAAKKITPFVEPNMPVTGSPGQYLDLAVPAYSGTLPLRLRYQSIQSLGQMDGVIEVFPIRKIIDHTMPLAAPRWHSPIGVDMSFMMSAESYVGPSSRPQPSLYPLSQIVQEMNFTEKFTHPCGTLNPFNDRSNAASGSITLQLQSSQLTEIPLYRSAGSGSFINRNAFFQNYFTSSIHPYSDSTRTEGQHDAVFSRWGRGFGFIDASLTGVLLQMTSAYDYPMFDKHVYGSPAGFTYTLSHMTGWKMGTDSIAFGGLKK